MLRCANTLHLYYPSKKTVISLYFKALIIPASTRFDVVTTSKRVLTGVSTGKRNPKLIINQWLKKRRTIFLNESFWRCQFYVITLQTYSDHPASVPFKDNCFITAPFHLVIAKNQINTILEQKIKNRNRVWWSLKKT